MLVVWHQLCALVWCRGWLCVQLVLSWWFVWFQLSWLRCWSDQYPLSVDFLLHFLGVVLRLFRRMNWSIGSCWNVGVDFYLIFCRMWIEVVLCVICRYIGSSASKGRIFWEEFCECTVFWECRLFERCLLGSKEHTWPDRMKRIKIGFVLLGVVVGIEQKIWIVKF